MARLTEQNSDNATAYDGLNRLVNFQRGTLSSSGNNGSGLDTVSTNQRTQGWTLDQLGNWSSSSTNGSSTSRTTNSQNEVTAVGAASLTFDNNGDTTTDESVRPESAVCLCGDGQRRQQQPPYEPDLSQWPHRAL